jgi:hypothetical protein
VKLLSKECHVSYFIPFRVIQITLSSKKENLFSTLYGDFNLSLAAALEAEKLLSRNVIQAVGMKELLTRVFREEAPCGSKP